MTAPLPTASGAIFVDNTTTSADVIERHAVAAAAGLGFVDAPVSGGQAGAEGGILTVMCGGDETTYARAEPVIAAFGKSVRGSAAPGRGSRPRWSTRSVSAGLCRGCRKGSFGRRAGLDMDAVLASISGGAAMSWQMVNRGETMLADKFDFGFAVDWMIKDLGICLDEAEDRRATAGDGNRAGILQRGRGQRRQQMGYLKPDHTVEVGGLTAQYFLYQVTI